VVDAKFQRLDSGRSNTDLEEVLSLSLEGSDIELSVSPKGIRTSPYDLYANRSDRRESREGDRWFESISLHRRVSCEPTLNRASRRRATTILRSISEATAARLVRQRRTDAEVAELGRLVGGVPALHDVLEALEPLVLAVALEPCFLDQPAAQGCRGLLILVGEIVLADRPAICARVASDSRAGCNTWPGCRVKRCGPISSR
jgi:hypothetical protein